jgi:GTP-binding protein EngB required for normal cell division
MQALLTDAPGCGYNQVSERLGNSKQRHRYYYQELTHYLSQLSIKIMTGKKTENALVADHLVPLP